MFEIEFDTERRRVRIRFVGALKGEDATGVVRALVRSPDFTTGIDGFVDLRAVDAVEMFGDDVRAAVDAVTRYADAFADSRWAIVADTDAAYGVARQFELMNADASFEVRTFRDADEAERWLESGE